MSGPIKTYYQILGVSEKATSKEIIKAYRKLALQWHPDKWSKKSLEERVKANEKMQKLNEAYEILSDPSKRKRYDNGETNFFPENDDYNYQEEVLKIKIEDFERWVDKVWDMPITLEKRGEKTESEELKQFREQMIKAIQEVAIILDKKKKAENKARSDFWINKAKKTSIKIIEKWITNKDLTSQDLGEYSDYKDKINSLDKNWEISSLQEKILKKIRELAKEKEREDIHYPFPKPQNSPNPNPETPDNPQPEPEEPKENEKVEEILNGFRTHKYDNLTQEELIKEIEKEELNGTSLQTLVSQLKIKVQELEEEIRELKAITPQTQEIKQEVQKRENQIQQLKRGLSATISNNNNNNNNPEPFPYLPVLGTIGIVTLLGLMAYKLSRKRIRR